MFGACGSGSMMGELLNNNSFIDWYKANGNREHDKHFIIVKIRDLISRMIPLQVQFMSR